MTSFNPSADIDDEQAIACIRAIADDGDVFLGKHVKKRMKERGFDTQDIIEVIETGSIVSKEFDEERKNWQYKIEGTDVEGYEGTIITVIISISRQHVLTVF